MAADEQLVAELTALLGERPAEIVDLPHGGNNVVVRVTLSTRVVVAKRYFRHPDDPRDRLGTEYAFLSFLASAGLDSVPQPIARDDDAGIGVYELLEGEPLSPDAAGLNEGLGLASLLARLHALRLDRRADGLPDAADSAFSLRAYFARLDARLGHVSTAASVARRFVDEELTATAETVRAAVKRMADDLGVDSDEEATGAGRTLSPGDIGLQNALRRADGTLAFVDFEYGGWDEPAHVIASSCLPPGVPLPQQHHLPVLRWLLDAFEGGPALAARVRVVYPLLALKWSMIVLNEFVDVGSTRRRFAGALAEDFATTQIAKSRELLRIAQASVERGSFLEALTTDQSRTDR